MKITIPRPQRKALTLFDVYMKLMLFMPLTTLFQTKIEFINRLLFIVLFFFQMIVLFTRMNKKSMVVLAMGLVCFFVTLYNTSNLSFDNQVVYYVNWLIYATIMCVNADKLIDWIKTNEFYVKATMFIWSALVGVSIFLPSSYYIKEGGARYFGSFTDSIFRLGPTALFIEILAIISIIIYKNKKDIIYAFIPLFCGFMGSSRTYFIVIVIVFIIALYYFAEKKSNFYILAIPIAIIGIIVFSTSSLSDKVQYTLDDSQYGDIMFRLTSGRNLIWEAIFNNYKQLDFIYQFFGSGFGYTNSVAKGLYAHNDFIEILATHGVLGLLLYLICFASLFKTYFKGKKMPALIIILVVMSWFINANLNMFYWYTCTVLSFPFLLAGVSCSSKKGFDQPKELLTEEIKDTQ